MKDIFFPREFNKAIPLQNRMSGDKFADEFYDSSAYTADISTKMRIPEHINAHGSLSNGEGGLNGKGNSALYDMQVPDRWVGYWRLVIFLLLTDQYFFS